ncbi:MAG: hypothetical protein H0X65_08510 [Gemmatimonadetes bacterium]|nr:hypothetical protein [Gemmatimonadota bacterium]
MRPRITPAPGDAENLPPGEILRQRLDWSPVSASPLHIRTGDVDFPLHPLAMRSGLTALQCPAPLGDPLPEYTTRRSIRSEVARRYNDPLIIFTDALRGVEVWQWVERVPERPAIYREHEARAGEDGALLLRRLAALGPATTPRSTWCQSGALQVEATAASVLPALLRVARRRYAAPFQAGGAVAQRLQLGIEIRHLAHETIEATEDIRLLRAIWAALREFAVLDPACGAGGRLLAAGEVLEPLYDACLERMQSWVREVERTRARHRPEKLSDFRAALARATDVRRHPDRLHFIRHTILQANLHGADPDPCKVAECRERLLHALGTGTASRPPILNLRVGGVALGVSTAGELRQRLGPAGAAVAGAGQIAEEAEAIGRARQIARRARVAADGDVAHTAGELDPLLSVRLEALRGAVDATAARGVPAPHPGTSQHGSARPLHLFVEWNEIMRHGGFDVVLGAAADAVRERRAPFGAANPAAPQPSPSPVRMNSCIDLSPGDTGYPATVAERLGAGAPATLTLRGNAELLTRPLMGIFCSANVPDALPLRALDAARDLRDAGIATIGGFHTPTEKAMLEFLLRGQQPVVVSPAREIEGMRLPSTWRRPFEEGRLLLVSRFGGTLRRPTTRTAEARMLLVGALASSVFIAHAAPASRTYRRAGEGIRWGLPVFTIDDPHNSDLLLLGVRPVPPWPGPPAG